MRPDEKDCITPFLKWPGGKRWLTSALAQLAPKTINRYIEPFLGGGALFFELRPKKALLTDINGDLVSTYIAIKDDWLHVDDLLIEHQLHHCEAYYYQVRQTIGGDLYERAARFIYLNRTCWNGLYRVNREGRFGLYPVSWTPT